VEITHYFDFIASGWQVRHGVHDWIFLWLQKVLWVSIPRIFPTTGRGTAFSFVGTTGWVSKTTGLIFFMILLKSKDHAST